MHTYKIVYLLGVNGRMPHFALVHGYGDVAGGVREASLNPVIRSYRNCLPTVSLHNTINVVMIMCVMVQLLLTIYRQVIIIMSMVPEISLLFILWNRVGVAVRGVIRIHLLEE